ncbi:MAG TPA: glycosyl hydrolase [Chloroflexia bacterium]|nr:glycosyl hydrolase [Chloroflexia bacterium]
MHNFQNPPAEFRITPFWFWNGAMEPQAVARQVREMAEKGVGGFFICARQGLEIPYLSEKWFERVKVAVEAAEQNGLEVWLYDEYPYPSGMSGGEVILRHPEAKQYNLLHYNFRASGGQALEEELAWARVLWAKAVPYNPQSGGLNWTAAIDLANNIGNFQAQTVFQKTGLTAYNDKRYFTYEPRKQLAWQAPEGDWQVIVFLEKEIEDFKYYGTYLDPCNREAVRSFIDTTYERYAEVLGGKLGKAVKGMFSDEVGIYGNPPWSPQLIAAFEKRTGYSLQDELMALRYSAGENTARVRYDYFQTLHLAMREAYHRQISEWCDAHRIKYITEVPSVRMTTQLYSHITGGDSAHEKLGRSLEWIVDLNALNFRANPKMVSSLARQLGIERAFIECFHSVGWSMTLQDAKWMIDRLAALGINFFNFHAFFYTLDGLRKHDAPPSQFLQNPYWPYFKKLTDYAGRLSYALSRGKAAVSIAVIDPTTSFWTHLGNPFHAFNYCGDDPQEEARLNRLKEDWAYLCKSLLLNQLDYDHLDPEILAQSRVEQNGTLTSGLATYSVLVMPPLANLEAAAWEKIKAFLEAGGTVISLGLLPFERIDHNRKIEEEALSTFGLSLDTAPRQAYWQTAAGPGEQAWVKGQAGAYFLPASGGLARSEAGPALVKLLRELVAEPVGLEVAEVSRKSLLVQQRDWPDGSKVVFISNQEGQELELMLTVNRQAFAAGAVEELDLEAGESRPLRAEAREEALQIPLRLAPYQARLLKINQGSASEATAQEQMQHPATISIEARRQWQVRAFQPNIARFGTFHFALDRHEQGAAENWTGGQAGRNWPEVEVKTVIDQCADLARVETQELPLHFSQIFGTPVRLSLAHPLTCWYQTAFEVEVLPPACRLMMDRSAIAGDYSFYLNGTELNAQAFQLVEGYDNRSVACEVRDLLVEGENSLVVKVRTAHDWDGLTDPLYLSGPFGVYSGADGRLILRELPGTAELRGGVQAGFPFYAGTLSLDSNFELSALPEEPQFEIKFEGWDPDLHDCVEVLVNGHSLGVRAWSPYAWQASSHYMQAGENRLEVRVTNTLSGMLEGRYFDYPAHRLLSCL